MQNFSLRFYAATTLLMIGIMLPVAVTFANHYKGTYPNEGLLWMSKTYGYPGYEYVTSPNCNGDETGAYSRIKNSTTGKSEMSRWKNGIQMKQYRCDGAWDSYTDIKIDYTSGHPSGAWGENHSTLASSSFCQFWGTSYPCGMLPTVHLNKETWNGLSSTNRQRLIMHETGHSNGLNHHCTSDAIMNDGTSSCNGGRWSSVMEYQPTDRTGINSVYPN